MTEQVATRVGDIVSAFFLGPLEVLGTHAQALRGELVEALAAGPVTAADLDRLTEGHARAIAVETTGPVYGAGFIPSADLLADTAEHLSWWQGQDLTQLSLGGQAVDKQGFDLREREWYRVPVETGRPHLAGPYVDYLCSDEYTLTLSVPASIGGRPAGVLGLDMLMEDVERLLTPELAAMPTPIILASRTGRVLVSTDRSHTTGDVVRAPAHGPLAATPITDLPLQLLGAPAES